MSSWSRLLPDWLRDRLGSRGRERATPGDVDSVAAAFEKEHPPPPPGVPMSNAFAYIQFKAWRYLQVGPDEYRQGDALGQPPAGWRSSTLEAIGRGCQQILQYRGLRPDQPLEGLGTAGFDRLLQLFHFERASQAVVDSTPDAMLHRMEMRHSVDGGEIVFYNRVPNAPAGESGALADLWMHPLAGVTFPAETSDFVRGDLTRFDDVGHEVGVAYRSAGPADPVQVNLFVIPARGRSAADELSSAASQVAALHRVVTMGPHDSVSAAGMTGLATMMEIADMGGRTRDHVRSWIWVFESDGWLVKVRCTASLSHAAAAVTAALQRLVGEVGRPRTREIVE